MSNKRKKKGKHPATPLPVMAPEPSAAAKIEDAVSESATEIVDLVRRYRSPLILCVVAVLVAVFLPRGLRALHAAKLESRNAEIAEIFKSEKPEEVRERVIALLPELEGDPLEIALALQFGAWTVEKDRKNAEDTLSRIKAIQARHSDQWLDFQVAQLESLVQDEKSFVLPPPKPKPEPPAATDGTTTPDAPSSDAPPDPATPPKTDGSTGGG